VIISRARPEEVEIIMGWRRQRVAWLAELGEDQWSIPLPRSAVAAVIVGLLGSFLAAITGD
jgi:hypothetical protein